MPFIVSSQELCEGGDKTGIGGVVSTVLEDFR